MVFSPPNRGFLSNAINKWYSIANGSDNGGYSSQVEYANNYDGIEYQGNPNIWNISNVKSMDFIFAGKRQINHPDISTWDVSSVTDMYAMFYDSSFNGDISKWDVSSVTNMYIMFLYNDFFNQDISKWDVSSVINIEGMFAFATAFNQPIGNWNVSNVTNMRSMFYSAAAFNQDINTKEVTAENSPTGEAYTAWDVSSITDMNWMFYGAAAFNGDISNWVVSKVTTMLSVFNGAIAFNQPIGDWDVSSVTSMSFMFETAVNFNQDISNWDTSNVTNMNGMFVNAYSFNKDISSWNVSKVEDMREMFSGSVTFQNQFGGAIRVRDTPEQGQTTYKLPESAEPGGGFAVRPNELNLPLKFTNDGTITFNAYTTTDVNIKFRLEKNPAPDTEPSYDTDEITIIPGQTNYSITIPSQGTNEYNNVILYVVTRDVPVTINGLSINNDTPSNKMSFDQNISYWKVNQYKSDGTTPTELYYMFDNMPIKTGNPYGFSVPTPTYDEFNVTFVIKGANPEIVKKGSTYTDAGVFAAPNLTNLTTTSNVNTSIVGTYSVIYSGTRGNETVTATRTVFVQEVYIFETRTQLQTAINKWYELANGSDNGGYSSSLEYANKYCGTEYFGKPNTWDVKLVTDMSFLFKGKLGNNHPEIGNWNTCFVTTMESMFEESSFNNNIGGWNVHNVKNFRAMFKNNTHYDNAGSNSIDEWTTYWTHKKRC